MKIAIPLLACLVTTAVLANGREAFFESAAWTDAPETIEAKFPHLKVEPCPSMQEAIYADRAIGCATHELQAYKVADTDFIVSFHFRKADRSLAEVGYFALKPYAGDSEDVRRICESFEQAMAKRYKFRRTSAESKAESKLGIATYETSWVSPARRTRLDMLCRPMDGDEMVISAVLRPLQAPAAKPVPHGK
jgi:hypothetical protein